MMESDRSLEAVVEARRQLEELRIQLRRTHGPVVVVFIDLCGSTELKQQPQEDWLPRVGEFLLDVTRAVVENRGRVIKYIGDEVLSIFDDASAAMLTQRAESLVRQCDQQLTERGAAIAKYALDFGLVARVVVPGGSADVLGTCVDRCARIAKLLSPGSVLASADFVSGSPNPRSWKRISSIRPKGIAKSFGLYQLNGIGPLITLRDVQERMGAAPSPTQTVPDLREELQACREELDRLRRRS